MRDYSKVVPTFWTGKTGKALRARGSEALIVGMYLMTSPQSNMLGLFYQPVLYMAHETGLGLEGAWKGLQGAIEAGFCSFDPESEMVWVHEMAYYQIASELKATDNRCAGIQKDYDALPDNPFLADFFTKYSGCFHMTTKRGIQAPPKPLPSQEQEQEQEQDKGASAPPSIPPKEKPQGLDLGFTLPTWIPKEPWDGFVEMRKKQKKPMTDRARDLKIAELQRFNDAGYDVGAILDKSTANSWIDLYEPKDRTPSANAERPVI